MNDGTQSLIAGALFDFASWLTGQRPSFEVGSDKPVYPVLESLQKWASERDFDLEVGADFEWNKAATITTIEDLAQAGADTQRRIAAALRDFATELVSTNATNIENSLVRFASKRNLSVANPQLKWRAHWWH